MKFLTLSGSAPGVLATHFSIFALRYGPSTKIPTFRRFTKSSKKRSSAQGHGPGETFESLTFFNSAQKDEVHNETPLTEAEVKSLADRERLFQKAQKERLEAERKEAKRQRALARINKL